MGKPPTLPGQCCLHRYAVATEAVCVQMSLGEQEQQQEEQPKLSLRDSTSTKLHQSPHAQSCLHHCAAASES